MPENFSILKELASAITGILTEYGKSLGWKKIEEKRLIRKIRYREKFLKKKYEKSFESLKKLDESSFYGWLKEKRTISRILSFSNAEDSGNISMEQMRHSKELFFTDAFHMAQVHDFSEKEELRKVLNDLFQYVDELFWKSLDAKDVFLYKKCVLEIRQLIREFTEDIIREIQYHGSFAEYIDNQRVLQKVQFKLDYRSEEIPFVGRTEEFSEIDAFCASEKQLSWWAVIGKGGSGKSRLVYEYIKRNMGSAEWKMCFLREEFFSQAGGGGKYKKWNTWTYDKNLLLVVDYVQKYAKEVAQWIEGLSVNGSITRKIRILLLERTDGEQSLWMREGFEKQVVGDLKYDKDFLRLQSLDIDLISFAIKYAEKNKKHISEADAKDAWDKLKSIDADTRILYFIMILEAVFDNEPWRNWNRNDLAGYIVRRDQEDIAVRFKHDKDRIRSFNRVLAFCTATKELPVFELPENLPEKIKKEIEVIKNNSGDKHELCTGMQLEKGVLQPVTPDIIGEYMVLYIIDQYYFNKEEKEEFIRDLWTYDSGNFIFFVYHLFQDKMGEGSYDDITKLILFDAVPYDNVCVMEDYSNLLWGMTGISDLKQDLVLVERLEKIYCDYSFDETIACLYAKGLFYLSSRQDVPERKRTVEGLRRVATANEGNVEIQTAYAGGLANLSSGQEVPERKETVEELRRVAATNEGNVYIQTVYANVLLNLSVLELKGTVEELRRLAVANEGNVEIQTAYAKSLFNLSSEQEVPERKGTVEELRRIAAANEGNGDIQMEYANVLLNLSSEQEVPERKGTVEELRRIAAVNEGNENIQTVYAKGLFNLSCGQELPGLKGTVEELRGIAATNEGNGNIQTVYAKGLVNLSSKQEQPGLKGTVEELRRLAATNELNVDIQTAYAKGLFNLSSEQELLELKVTVKELGRLAAENAENAEIQEIYTEIKDILGSE